MTRRNLLALGFFTTPIVAAAVACSFPDVSFSAADTDSGSNNDDGAASPPDANGFDGASVPGVTRDGGRIDGSACLSTTPCDCDNDGYRSVTCDASVDAAAQLKPGDCDDFDGFRHPDQGFSDAGPSDDSGLWDWNCTGKNEKAYEDDLVINCAGLLLIFCTGGNGIESAVNCGQNVTKGACQNIGGNCRFQFSGTEVQLCR